MLRVTVELVPYGDEARSRRVGTLLIANDGADRYVFTGKDDRGNVVEGKVMDHDRTESVWSLLHKTTREA